MHVGGVQARGAHQWFAARSSGMATPRTVDTCNFHVCGRPCVRLPTTPFHATCANNAPRIAAPLCPGGGRMHPPAMRSPGPPHQGSEDKEDEDRILKRLPYQYEELHAEPALMSTAVLQKNVLLLHSALTPSDCWLERNSRSLAAFPAAG